MTESAAGSTGPGTLSSDYSDAYFRHYNGPPYTYDEQHWHQFFGSIATNLVALFAPRTSYDAGCAIGLLVRAMTEAGVDARGGDVSEFAISGAPEELAARLEVHNLTDPLDRRYDLITCIEVLEHLSPDDARAAVANLCAATDVIVLSTTPDDFRDPTHINIRPSAGWAQEFAVHGYYRRTDIDAGFLSPWSVVFARRRPTPAEIVVDYETLLGPLLREVQEKRRALLELQRDFDQATAGQPDPAERERSDRQAESKRLQMVDELIGLRAELAEAKVHGEHAVVEAGREAARLRDVVAGLEAELAEAYRQRDDAVQAQVELENSASRAAAETAQVLDERDRTVAAIKRSYSWRVGQALLRPISALRRRIRR